MASGAMAQTRAPRVSQAHKGLQRWARRLLQSPPGTFGVIVVVALLATAILAPVIAPFDPGDQNLAVRLLPPNWVDRGSSAHPLGTDALGRDILSRLIYGSRVSMIVGFSTVLVRGTIGVFLGLVAGYYRGKLDAILMRFADIQLAVPFLLLAIAIMSIVGPGLRNVVLALGVTGWMIYGRLVRSEVIVLREREFTQAARLLGATNGRIILRHILPNAMASIVVLSTLEVARMIIAEASLSFLGLGVPLDVPSWGGMVAQGRNYLAAGAWWLSVLPGLAIMLVALGINLFGDWLRDTLDPTLRHRT